MAIKLGYTTIQHGPRLQYGLSMNQYVLAAAIFHLSGNPRAPVPGWCSASKPKLAAFFGFSERTVYNLLNELEKGGWVEYHPQQAEGLAGLLRTTTRWYECIECNQGGDTSGLPQHIADPLKKLQGSPAKSSGVTPAKSAGYNNTSNKDTHNGFSFRGNRGFESTAEVEPFLETENDASHTGGARENSDTSISTPPEVVALADEIAALFHVSPTNFFHQYAKVRRFVYEQSRQAEGLDYLRAQFYAYREERKATRTKCHNLDNYLGTPESSWQTTADHKPAAWNMKSWVSALAEITTNEVAQVRRQRSGQPGNAERLQTGAEAALARLRDKALNDPTNSRSNDDDE